MSEHPMTHLATNGAPDLTADLSDLLCRGFAVIPIEPRGKKPIIEWKPYQTRRPTFEELEAWFGNGRPLNMAIVTGVVSGIVVIDVDSDAGEAWVGTHLAATPWQVRTGGGGLHLYYRHPGNPIPNKVRIRTGDNTVKVDVRADGGYVIAPGSVHESGAVYQREGDWSVALEDVPVFDLAWLPADSQVAGTAPASGSPSDDRTFVIARARKYLEATPGAVEGEGGDTATFQVCCRIVRGFGLEPHEARPLLQEWNQKCVPPWSDVELLQKVENAAKYGSEPLGGRRDRLPIVDRGDPRARCSSNDFHLTDSGNAEYFAALYGDRLRCDHRRGRWLIWLSHRWAPDADAEVERLALRSVRQRQAEALKIDDSDQKKRAMNWALGSESRQRLAAMLDLAKSVKPIADAGENWDSEPWLLGVLNGVLDLRTGTLRPGHPGDRITMTTAVPFDPVANVPRFLRFLDEIFDGDRELAAFAQRFVGYALTGIVTEQVLALFYGKGANGKSTFLRVISHVLGDYAWNMPFSTVELRQRASIPNDLAALDGKRFVTASETNDGTRLNEARIKALTGCDRISARFMRAEWFSFDPVAKFVLAVNHKPVVQDDSIGFWRRMRMLPFRRCFQGSARDEQLEERLRAEGPGILRWAVDGCAAWQRVGLGEPTAVQAATTEYQQDSDPLAEFIEERCEAASEAITRAAALQEAYQRWADRQRLSKSERLSGKEFGRRMAERFVRKHTREGWQYEGVRLVTDRLW